MLAYKLRWFVSGFVALVLSGSQALAGCSQQVKLRFECPSPDKQFVAAFYVLSGGGAAGWQYQHVNIRRVGTAFREEPWLAQLKNARDVRLTWLDASHLRVEYPDAARLDDQLTTYRDGSAVELEYRAQPAGEKGFSDGAGGCVQPASPR